MPGKQGEPGPRGPPGIVETKDGSVINGPAGDPVSQQLLVTQFIVQ